MFLKGCTGYIKKDRLGYRNIMYKYYFSVIKTVCVPQTIISIPIKLFSHNSHVTALNFQENGPYTTPCCLLKLMIFIITHANRS